MNLLPRLTSLKRHLFYLLKDRAEELRFSARFYHYYRQVAAKQLIPYPLSTQVPV
jgi:hypothetical protein